MFALALRYEQARCLTAITYMSIHFNLTGYREFGSMEEVQEFRDKWKGHFYDLSTLGAIEIIDRRR